MTKRKMTVLAAAVVLVLAAVVLVAFLAGRGRPSDNGATPEPTQAAAKPGEGKEEGGKPDVEKQPGTENGPDATATPVPAGDYTPLPTADPDAQPQVDEPLPTSQPEGGVTGPTPIPAPTFEPVPTTEPTPEPTKEPTKAPTATAKPTVKSEPTVKPEPTKEPAKKAEASAFYRRVAGICGIDGEDIEAELKKAGIVPSGLEAEDLKRKDAFVIIHNMAMRLGKAEMPAAAVNAQKYGVLSDVPGSGGRALSGTEAAAAYYVYGNGIVEGKSDGAYLRTCSLDPFGGLMDADAELYLDRFEGKAAKRVLAPDGQMTRTSGLKNMNLYPYLLESIPDSFYLLSFQFMRWTDDDTGMRLYESGRKRDVEYEWVPVAGEEGAYNRVAKEVEDCPYSWKDGEGIYASPAMYRKVYGTGGKYDESTAWGSRSAMFDLDYQKKLESTVEEYLRKAFSVDYRKTPSDREWREFMYAQKEGQSNLKGEKEAESINAEIDAYLALIRENHTVLECDIVRAEASTVYEDKSGTFIRCYVHYRVVSADRTETVYVDKTGCSGYISPLVYALGHPAYRSVQLKDVKPGEWRDGVFDIRIGTNAVYGREPVQVLSPDLIDIQGSRITDY